MKQANYITLVTQSKLTKFYDIQSDGSVKQNDKKRKNIYDATAEVLEINSADELRSFLISIKDRDDVAVLYGYIPSTEDGTPYPLVSKNKLAEMKDAEHPDAGRAFTRTKDNFVTSGWLAFDVDCNLKPDDWLDKMDSVISGAGQWDVVVVPSNSSRIMRDDQPALPHKENAFHLMVLCDENPPRHYQRDTLLPLAVKAGLGDDFMDISTGKPEQPLYQGRPRVADGLTVSDPEIYSYQDVDGVCPVLDDSSTHTVDLALAQVLQPDGDKWIDRVKAAGLYLELTGDDEFPHLVRCINAAEHSESEEAYFSDIGEGKFPDSVQFKCHHVHCETKFEDYTKAFKQLIKIPAQTGETFNWTGDSTMNQQSIDGIKAADFIIPHLVVRGHLLVLCADPNAGKTAVMEYLCADMVKAGYNVYYFNNDTAAADLHFPFALAQKHGWHLICPDQGNMSAQDMYDNLVGMTKADVRYDNEVMIIDTLKNFISVLGTKDHLLDALKLFRALTAKGMTVVLLHHNNKHRAADGSPIYEGFNEIHSNSDELIYLEAVKEPLVQTVTTYFDHAKAKTRAAITQQLTFEIDRQTRVVTQLGKPIDTRSMATALKIVEDNADVIDLIMDEVTRSGGCCKQDLIDCAAALNVGSKKVNKVLDELVKERLKCEKQADKSNRFWYTIPVLSSEAGSQ